MEHEAAALMQGDRQDGAEQKRAQRFLGDLGARFDDDLAPLAHEEAADPGIREAGLAPPCTHAPSEGEAAHPPPPFRDLGPGPVPPGHSPSFPPCHTTNASCSDSVSSSRRQAARTAPSSTYGAIAAESPKTTSLSAAVWAPSSARTKFGLRSDLPPRQRTASGRIPVIAPRNTKRVQPSRSF